MSNESDKNFKPDNDKPAPKHEGGESKPTPPPAKLNVELPPNHEDVPCKKKHPSNSCWCYFKKIVEFFFKAAEFGAFSAIILTAIYIGGQLGEMKKDRTLAERAWVAVDSYTNGWKNGTNIFFNVTAKNYGKTPALNFTMWVGIDGLPGGDTNRGGIVYILPKTYGKREELQTLVPNGIYSKGTETFSLAPTNAYLERDEKTNFYLLGVIKYDDIFTNQHWTRFCWRVEWEPTNFACIYYGTSIGNTTDENPTNKDNPIPTMPIFVPKQSN